MVLADALFDNYFLACEFRDRGIELVVRVQAERVGSRTVEVQPGTQIVEWMVVCVTTGLIAPGVR